MSDKRKAGAKSEQDEESTSSAEAPAAEGEATADAEVVVTVKEDALPDFAAVARRLEDAGLTVEHKLDFLGQVTGRASGVALEALRQVDGVDDVAVSEKVQLPPPGSIVQ